MPVGESIGLIHLIASLIALATGSWVLIGPFFRMVGIATGAVILVGALPFVYSKKRWEKLAKALHR